MLLQKLKNLKLECLTFSRESNENNEVMMTYIKHINHDIKLISSKKNFKINDFKILSDALGYYKNGASYNQKIANEMYECERLIEKTYS